ncbi:hypothetical protein [Yersinia enterocolitica]
MFTVSAGGQPKYSQDFAPLPGGLATAFSMTWPLPKRLLPIKPAR